MEKALNAVWHNQRNNEDAPFGTCQATTIAMVIQWICEYFKLDIHKFCGWDGVGQLDDYVSQQLATREAWNTHFITMPDSIVANRIKSLSDDDLKKWTLYLAPFNTNEKLQQDCIKPRNNPFVLKWYLEKLGLKDTFTQGVNFEQIKASIDKNIPVITAGFYFRKRPNGTSDTIVHVNGVIGYNDVGFVMNDSFGNATKFYLPNEKGEYDGCHVIYPYDFCKKSFSQQHILSIQD